ncbi:hypothetical protein HD554DRAFT_1546856 [Boletus coccyginus]|nr:hypothetical protein HD554DRAFT_1546856 [Boletus coccyginus]
MIRTSQDRYRPLLTRFAREVWGNPGAVLQQHLGGFQFIDLGAYFDAFQSFFAGVQLRDKLLVREEYRIALKALEEDTYKGGAYVVGQPGIGKTLFLVYFLVMRLGQKQPVALQFLNGRDFYALFKDNVEFHQLDDQDPLFEYPFLWALCDSNKSVTTPSEIFLNKRNHVRVILTTSPKPSRWKEWGKQAGASPYAMDVFSDEEVVHLAILLGLDVPRMTTLSRNWGNVPRALLKYIDAEDLSVEESYRQLAGRAVRNCGIMIDGGSQFDFPDDPPSSFYFLRPMNNMGTIDRTRASIYVPTQTLCCLLAEALQDQNNHVELQFYHALSCNGGTRQAAGSIFETWFHRFLVTKRKIYCHWLAQDPGDDADLCTLSMPTHTSLIPGTKAAPQSAIPPYYWAPLQTNFAGIDSALVLEDKIFVFQMTLSANHRSPIKGLRDLRKLLPYDLKDLPWRVVFVGPEEGPIEAVAKSWSRLSFPSENDFVPVGWSALDPAQGGVIYKESEELLKEVKDKGRAPTPIDE